MMAASFIQTGAIFYLLSLFINNHGIFDAFSMEELSIYASLTFFAFIYSPFSTLLAILFNYLSRVHEFEADRYAADTTGKPAVLARSLKKLSRENLSNLTPHFLMVIFSYSHPPVLERIRTLNRMSQNQNWQRAMKHLDIVRFYVLIEIYELFSRCLINPRSFTISSTIQGA